MSMLSNLSLTFALAGLLAAQACAADPMDGTAAPLPPMVVPNSTTPAPGTMPAAAATPAATPAAVEPKTGRFISYSNKVLQLRIHKEPASFTLTDATTVTVDGTAGKPEDLNTSERVTVTTDAAGAVTALAAVTMKPRKDDPKKDDKKDEKK